MHLQIIVPFMQLTWKESTQDYTVETVIPITTRYHLVNEEIRTDGNGNPEIQLTFFLSEGYVPDPYYEGISHVMRKFKLSELPPPDGAGNVTASVLGIVYNAPYGDNPGEPLLTKKSKMRLADAEAGVDPVVHF